MKKSVWITILEKNEGLGRLIFEEMTHYGLAPGGHFWDDDLANFAWAGAIAELTRDDCAAWIICGQTTRFAEPATRQGLALLALAAQSAHGNDFPIIISPGGGTLDPGSLPTPLRAAEVVLSGLGTKALVRANAKRPDLRNDYRLAVHPLPGLGLWFEVGPGQDPWQGAFFGCTGSAGAAPDAHGVGLAGVIPNRSTLHYPVQDMKITLGKREFSAWGAKNPLSPAQSYFVRVTQTPDALIFGPFPDVDDPEVFSITLV